VTVPCGSSGWYRPRYDPALPTGDPVSLEDYLAEEVALDFSDGFITRREALRRLGLMGLSTVAATTLLAACAKRGTGGTTATPSASTGPDPGPAGAVPAEAVNFPGPNGNLLAAWAPARGEAKGAVLVIHENKGLTDHIRSVAGRLARDGYSGLAIDLLSEEGGTGRFTDPAEATAALGKVPQERFNADMKAGLSELVRRNPGKKLGIVGFCFGGGQVWRLLAAGEPRLAAAAPFYGPSPEAPDFSGSKAAVLAIYGEQDERVNAGQKVVADALEKAKLPHELKVYQGAGHAFFNDTGERYNAAAAKQAYADLLGWFGRYLA
jgi:carboxymethylenebutenolidase